MSIARADSADGHQTYHAQSGSSTPVVGGTPVPPGKWPDTVAVLGAQGSCSGTLIAPNVVLTAGHCAEINPSQVIINTTDYAAQGGTHVNVARTVAYPEWETTYDVSVVVLAKAVTNVQPRAVGTGCTFSGFKSGKQVHLVGFGLTDAGGAGDNTKLNETMAPVTDPECTGGKGCNRSVAPGGEFVAGGNNHDSCFGDSGGPVYLDTARGPIVIGAVSRGVDGSATPCGGGGIYVRTDKIVKWIEDTAAATIEKDDCGATGELGSDGDDTVEPSETTGGCSASSDASLSVAGFVVLVLALRRPARRRQLVA